ncbi:hypothetical protein H310_10720 [Aphanomyces invadans]|uniref:Uncharacterized protein n=1 Tax=Aphanomyces invadans TaxID=157072 RepID=A0A024TPZ6_9STRA|nr:hypothetical protein H310_10720 [Aphanomyces invadans]ETV96079.1 hypothetical protein H310_10720 [Aphanomyces invadans]|eukprot:XP_008875390.1 hypothetical protein H310_10720 [Aphanomyces invadans]
MSNSTCPRCFAGTCKEHSKAALGSAAAEKADLIQRMYDNLVGKQLEKLKKAQDAAKLDADTEQYRDSLAKSRDKKREKRSYKAKGSSSSVAALHSGSGLNPQALAAICSSDDDTGSKSTSSRRDDRKKRRKKDSKRAKKAMKKSSKKRRASSDSSSDSDRSDTRPPTKRRNHD